MKHSFDIGNGERITEVCAIFREKSGDHAIFNNHGVAPRTISEAEMRLINQHAHLTREVRISIWDHGDTVIYTQTLRPCIHHKTVIDRKATNGFDPGIV